MRQVFKKGVTGDLAFRPPDGPPTSGTVTIKQPDGTVFRSDVVAATPAVDTTLAVAATAGAKQVRLADASAVVPGQDLWVGDLEDARDLMIVEEVDYATEDVFFRRALRFDQKIGAEAKSGELKLALLAGEVDEELESALATWAYVVDGSTYYAEQVWDVVLREFRLLITETGLLKYVSSVLLDQSEQTFTELITQAKWLISQKLRFHNLKPEWIVDMTEFERVIGLTVRIILLCEEIQHSMHRLAVLQEARTDLEEEWEILLRTKPRWIDRNADTVVDTDEVAIAVGQPVLGVDFS
jgi:hypothetical protein